jgi:hypothetical protein
MNYHDISTAPTVDLPTHRIATLGGNQIKCDAYRTRILPRVPRKKTWQEITADLIRDKTKRLRRLLTEAIGSV